MKRIFSLIVCFLLLLCLSACSALDESTAEKINAASNFEFDLLENVEDYDFGGYGAVYGFGVTKYYGTGYELTEDKNGETAAVGEYVSYDVTAWPDESDGGRFITSIYCTDMDVRVLGLTLENSLDEFSSVLSDMGFDVEKSDPYGACGAIRAQKGGICVYICDYGQNKTFSVSADVSNRLDLQY